MRSLIRSILMLAALAPAAAGAHEGPTTGTAAEVRAEAPNPTIEKWAARFKGSVLLLDQSVSAETVAPAAQLSYIPSYQWWFSLRPREGHCPVSRSLSVFYGSTQRVRPERQRPP